MGKKKNKVEVVKSVPKRAVAIKKDMGIENLIATAIKEKTPVETMERILAMRKELRAEQAKEAFDNAMADFQGECPIIKKTKAGGVTKTGQTAYYFAPIDVIVEQTREFISKHGFSYMIKTKVGKDDKAQTLVTSTCIVKHRLGHSESSEMEVPLGGQTGVMSNSQVVAAASTFSKRYAFLNAFGIMTGDDDNDGADDKKKKQVAQPQPPQPAVGEHGEPLNEPFPDKTIINKPVIGDELFCHDCGNIITPAEDKYSRDKFADYGLCRNCQKDYQMRK